MKENFGIDLYIQESYYLDDDLKSRKNGKNKTMSLDQREYMQPGYKPGRKQNAGVSVIDRVRFALWRLFHWHRAGGNSQNRVENPKS